MTELDPAKIGNGMDKTYLVRVLPHEWTFEATSATPLLLAAQRANIALPSSCRNGTCRTCMCRLVAGSVRYDIEWPGLSFDEKRDGYILPCIAYPSADLEIEELRAQRTNPES